MVLLIPSLFLLSLPWQNQKPQLRLLQDIEKVLEPLLFLYKLRRRPGEAFGDFCARQGFDALRAYSQASGC